MLKLKLPVFFNARVGDVMMDDGGEWLACHKKKKKSKDRLVTADVCN